MVEKYKMKRRLREWDALEHGIPKINPQQRIGIVGIGRGAGATTVSVALAAVFGNLRGSTTLQHRERTETEQNLLCDNLCLKKYFKKGEMPIYHGVNWDISGYRCKETEAETVRNSRIGAYLLMDEPDKQTWKDYDILIGVIDPMPSAVRAGLADYDALRKEAERRGIHAGEVLWVLNKDNQAVYRRDLEQFLKLRFDFSLPLLPQTFFYEAAYQDIPWFHGLYEKQHPGNFEKQAAEFRIAIERLSSTIFSRLPEIVI